MRHPQSGVHNPPKSVHPTRKVCTGVHSVHSVLGQPAEASYFVSVCPASAFGGLFRKELQYIKILDDYTETHYDLVFGKFHFDSAKFIFNEARDILLVSFPSKESLSAERASEFVTAVVLNLVQTIASVRHDENLNDDEKKEHIFAIFLIIGYQRGCDMQSVLGCC